MIYLKNNTDNQLINIPRGAVAPSTALTEFATKEYVDNAIAEAIANLTGGTYNNN